MKPKTAKRYGKKIARLALLAGLALLSFLIEGLFPPVLIPGAKLGIGNAFSLFALLLYGLPEALAVVAIKTVLGSIFAGNLSLLLYSFTAGVLSVCAARIFLCAFPYISVVAVSVLSAAVHNTVQCAVYALLSGTVLVFSYLPYLLLLGILSGALVGFLVVYTVKALPQNFAQTLPVKKENLT